LGPGITEANGLAFRDQAPPIYQRWNPAQRMRLCLAVQRWPELPGSPHSNGLPLFSDQHLTIVSGMISGYWPPNFQRGAFVGLPASFYENLHPPVM